MTELHLEPNELRAERERLGMTREEFGAYLAKLVGNDVPYSYQRITDYENGGRAVPMKVEVAFLREQVKHLKSLLRNKPQNGVDG